jgi:Phytase
MLKSVMPRFETPPLFDDEAGGNADGDDPAIWVHPQHPPLSPVIATPPAPSPGDTPPGRFNNVDTLYGFLLGDRTVDLAVTTDRGRDQLRPAPFLCPRAGGLFSGYFASGWERRRVSSMRVECVAIAPPASLLISSRNRARMVEGATRSVTHSGTCECPVR